MKRVAVILAALLLIAATPDDVLGDLEANGYFIEDGSSASEQVVSDAVFDGRADGGRLYLVVLAEEPPGGAPTFSDSTLDRLDGDGYVVTVAPETVGFAGDGTHWTSDQMNSAVDTSLSGNSDDDVVQLFIESLTGGSTAGGSEGSGGGISIMWIILIGVVIVGVWMFVNRRNTAKRTAGRLEQVKGLAREKLDEVANDILEMEDEVSVSDNAEVKEHYQRASAMYSKGMEDNRAATTVQELLKVSEELDLAIWELDCAEAMLDGKPKPDKPEPPKPEAVPPPSPEATQGQGVPPPVPTPGGGDFDRRPQRHSTGSSDMMTMLMAMMAMGSMRGGRRGGGLGGGFGGGGFGGGGGRMGGGGFRGGGGRMRGGGRRG